MTRLSQLEPDMARTRLRPAGRRLSDLMALDDLRSADADERQQLLQEFFFHLTGAAEFAAQVANERRSTPLPIDDVTIQKVRRRLDASDPLHLALGGLHADTRSNPAT